MWDLQHLFHPVILYLHHNPQSAGIIAFCIAFAEALAVIGTVIPGSVTMTAVGALIGSGVIPATSTIVWAIFGAIGGDSLSYLIGLYYKGRIHKVWPFTRYPHWLEQGEKFFTRHGGKSVIIGRFFGPARSLVPLIAGTLNMRPIRFLLAAVPSASVWAVCYMIPGILLGALSLELPPGAALEFIIAVLLVIFAIVILTWLARLAFLLLRDKIDRYSQRLWQDATANNKYRFLVKLLTNPLKPENHRQLILLVYACITGIIFLLIMLGVFTHSFIIDLNKPIYHLLRSFRTSSADNIILLITTFGSKYVMVPGSILLLLWFLVKRNWRTAGHWLAAILLSGGIVETIKKLFYNARPGHLFHGPLNSSFPSGHTTLTVTLMGFFAVLIAGQLPTDKKHRPYYVAIWLGALVAFSRMYLGCHWLTDITAATFLGISICLVLTISYRRSTMPKLPVKQTIIAAIVIYALVLTVDSVFNFAKLKQDMTPYWPVKTITLNAWQQRTTQQLPLYRNNRLGGAREAFNIEWLGRLDTIRDSLIAQGWQQHIAKTSFSGFLHRLATITTKHRLPLLTQLYHNRPAVLLLTKDLNDKDQAVILQLWRSDIDIAGTKLPLWFGVVRYQHAPHKLLTPRKNFTIHRFFFGATRELVPYITNFRWKQLYYPPQQQPNHMRNLHWDGKLLLITQRKKFQ